MKTKKTLIGLGLGQIISLLSTLIASIASEIARKGISAPTSQTFLGYVSLAIVYGGIMLYRRSAIKVSIELLFLISTKKKEKLLFLKTFDSLCLIGL
jgi:solute carrier family 35 protein F1/2